VLETGKRSASQRVFVAPTDRRIIAQVQKTCKLKRQSPKVFCCLGNLGAFAINFI